MISCLSHHIPKIYDESLSPENEIVFMKKKGKNYFANKSLPISQNQMANANSGGAAVAAVTSNGRAIHNDNDKQTSNLILKRKSNILSRTKNFIEMGPSKLADSLVRLKIIYHIY